MSRKEVSVTILDASAFLKGNYERRIKTAVSGQAK